MQTVDGAKNRIRFLCNFSQAYQASCQQTVNTRKAYSNICCPFRKLGKKLHAQSDSRSRRKMATKKVEY